MKKALLLGVAIAAGIITASLFVPLKALSQQAKQVCPVTGIRVSDVAKGGEKLIVIKNESQSMPIKSVLFHSYLTDENGNEVQASPAFKAKFSSPEQTWKGYVDPGTTEMFKNKMIQGGQPEWGHVVTYVKAVQFRNGTVWQDDGSHSCTITPGDQQ